MKVVNLPTVTVDTTAGGTEILSSVAARIATTEGMNCAIITPSVDIALVDAGGLQITTQVPGAVVGTIANSGAVCPAGVSTTVWHNSGPLRAISAGSSTVKITLGETP